ncbi:MAG: hypothetical protein E7380_00365 [Clostridiales bacterium]|nr:hypothetical protein [Clostridiales bacterium]
MKKLLTAMLGVTMCASVATGVTMMASAEPVDSSDWALASGVLTMQWDEANGAHVISGTTETAYGARAYLKDPVKVDGLTIELYTDTYENGGLFGIGLVSPSSPTDFSPQNDALDIGIAPNIYDGQTRVTVAKSHDSNAAIGSSTVGGAVAGAFASSSVYVSDGQAIGAKYVINYLEEEDVYQVDYTMTYGTVFQTQQRETTVYVPTEHFTSVMDENGEVVISTWGMNSKAYTLLVKITESEEEGSVPGGDVVTPEPEPEPDPEPEVPDVVYEEKDWIVGAGATTLEYNATTGYSKVANLNGWGTRAGYSHKVKVDGLTVEMYTDEACNDTDKQCFGFSFVSVPTGWALDAAQSFTAHFRPSIGYASTQTRLSIAKNHDFAEAGLLCYKTAEDVYNPAVNPESTFYSSMVWNLSDEYGVRFHFEFVDLADTDNDVYKLTATIIAGEKHAQQPQEQVMYFADNWVESVADENGEVYISAWGFSSDAHIPSVQFKIDDANTQAYKAGAYAAAVEAISAYGAAADAAVAGTGSFSAALEAKAAAVAAIPACRGNDQSLLTAEVAKVDEVMAGAQDLVKAEVQAVYDVAFGKLAAFEDESTINKMSVNDFKASVDQANAAYEEFFNMLTAENQEYFVGLSEDLAYGVDFITVKSWIISYEAMANALDATAETIIDDINTVKEYKLAYVGSATETLLNTLEAADVEALNGRIAAADQVVADMEARFSVEVKDELLSVVEAALEEDLTIKFNLDDAKNAWTDLHNKVAITEEDGEVYTRYTAAYAALKAACEAYVTAEINAVSDALENEFTEYSAFKAVRDRFYLIRLNYLYEENADITAAHEALSATIKENVWFNVTTTDIAEVEWAENGLYFEQTPAFPSRLNWNQKLNLVTGAEVVVELTEMAYYNPGDSANNLCFNFLMAPDSYKSTSDGISIIIWLFPTESNVQIFNNNDVSLGNKSIATPMDGATITISVQYAEYYDFVADNTYYAYVIKVNEAEIVLTEAQLTQYGYEVSNDCYFSMGSFADDKSNPNKMTLVSVNGKDLGYVEPEPQPQPQPKPEQPKEEEGGCGSVIGGVSAAIAILGAAAVVLKKKEN